MRAGLTDAARGLGPAFTGNGPQDPLFTYRGRFQLGSGNNSYLLQHYIKSCLYPSFSSFRNRVSKTFSIYRSFLFFLFLIFLSSSLTVFYLYSL